MVKVAVRRKSQGIEKNKLFFQGSEKCQNLRYESLIVVDPKYIDIASLYCIEYKILTKRNRYFLTSNE